MKIVNTCNYTVDAIGGAYGLANIQTVLGIIVLILTILNVLINATIRIVGLVKKRKYEQITQVLEDTIEELKEVDKK